MTNDKIEEEILKKSLEGVEYNNFIITRGHIQKAISLTRAEYEKEINDLKEMEKIYIEISEEFLEFKEQTSKKVEEFENKYDFLLKGNFTPEQLLAMAYLKKEFDEIFTLQNQTPQVKEKDRLRSPEEKPARNKPQREEVNNRKAQNLSDSSPEEDLCENCGHRGWEHNKGNECCFEFGDLYCPCEEFIPKKEVKK